MHAERPSSGTADIPPEDQSIALTAQMGDDSIDGGMGNDVDYWKMNGEGSE
jgi:hypothetical protein